MPQSSLPAKFYSATRNQNSNQNHHYGRRSGKQSRKPALASAACSADFPFWLLAGPSAPTVVIVTTFPDFGESAIASCAGAGAAPAPQPACPGPATEPDRAHHYRIPNDDGVNRIRADDLVSVESRPRRRSAPQLCPFAHGKHDAVVDRACTVKGGTGG
ncbi:hypothetical protein HPP92_019407 [Vanilla planifolia]|uniref:Uncharacterized protein n=1 Tax=Vanilla planifolia TaxID=51239 RepID=A0A835Q6D5_VANPL|nr:hypothetical protein HPP92_019407 [Vanilla planifolia]